MGPQLFHRRLKHDGLSLSFQECDLKLVLCHLDIAPRNILWLDEDDGALCIVDWASAGYYPRIFEWCSLDILRGKDFVRLQNRTRVSIDLWRVRGLKYMIVGLGTRPGARQQQVF